MNTLPSFGNYGNYSSNNYGAHSMVFKVGPLSVYFSYKTPVAFSHPRTGLVVRENDWGPTTGKHLNWINNIKEDRISGGEFEKQLAELTQE
jgi:hypothetical protein